MQPKLDFVTRLEVEISGAHDIGTNQRGLYRRVVPIIGGTFSGPRMSGTILDHGADWNVKRPDGLEEICATYTLRTTEGDLIMITNAGLRRLTPEQAAAGVDFSHQIGDFESWYYRTSPVFETSSDRYRWLTQSIFVGNILPPVRPKQALIEVYEVL